MTDIEKARIKFWEEKRIEDARRFEQMSASENLLDLKYQSDNLMLMGMLRDWMGKARNEHQKKTINDAILSLFRISSYVETMQTTSKMATLKMIDVNIYNKKIFSENRDLKKENEKLKQMIDDYENGRL